MKHYLLKALLIFSFILFYSSHIFSQGVNNVKLLNLTANTYSGSASKSFYVNIGSQMQVTDKYTFETWVYVDSKPSGASGYFPVIMDRRTVFSLYLIDKPSGGTGDYRIRFVARDNSDNIIASMRNDGVSGSTDYTMTFQKWHHIAISRDGTTARLFVDGHLLDSSTDPDFVLSTPSGNPFNVAARYWGSYQRFLDGALDEIRYSNIARYTSSFTKTVNSPPFATSGDANTILLFNFDKSNLQNSTSANSYTALIHNSPLIYSDWDGFPGDELPLPVTYIEELKASLNKDNTVDLSWATASEQINMGYTILRSGDAQHWDSIGFVAGAGNSNQIRNYRFRDSKPMKSNYYQLKQIDYNGAFNLSRICYLNCDFTQYLQVYPNPANRYINLDGIDLNAIEHLEIYNFMGMKIKSFVPKSNLIDVSDLSKGAYFIVEYNRDGKIQRLSFIKR